MTRPAFSRAIVIVIDSLGVGELPDAAAYGDQGSHTLGHIAQRVPLQVPPQTVGVLMMPPSGAMLTGASLLPPPS